MNRLRRRPRAFTLIEIMVVIGIVVLLVAIALPAITYARKRAKSVRTTADIEAIKTVLVEYQKDHRGQYPQSAGLNTGFAVLGRELMGIYGDGVLPAPPNAPAPPDPDDPPTYNGSTPYKAGDCVKTGSGSFVALTDTQGVNPSPGANWATFSPLDGLDGPGQKVNGVTKGYLQPEKFHHRGCALLDTDDNPILYFRGNGNPNISMQIANGPSFIGRGAGPKFNADDNVQFFFRAGEANDTNAVKRMQAMVGDLNGNGYIDGNESAAHNGSYILWAAGPDGFYGPKQKDSNLPITVTDVSKCDDLIVTP